MQYTAEECAENLSNALDAIEAYVREFVRLPESSVPAVCAWIAHTYLIDENGFPSTVTPRLGFTSAKPGGGKSTALAVVIRLARNGEVFMLPSKAGWMNAIERDHNTIGVDEMDKTFPRENSRMDLQAAINSGYAPDGGTILHGNRKVPTHAFVAFAGLGPVLKCNTGLAPLWHRTINVEMEPVFGVRFTEYDSEIHGRQTSYLKLVTESAMELATLVYGPGLRMLTPPMLDNLDARRDQIWRVLRRIGMAAGAQWHERIKASCADMESGRSGAAPVLSQAQRIWPDVRTVTYGESMVGTIDLIERLRALPDSPWAYLWPKTGIGPARELAALLEPHGLIPENVPVGYGGSKEKGYRLTNHRACPICSDTDETLAGTDGAGAERMEETGTDALTLSSLAASMSVQPVTSRAPYRASVPLFTPPAL